MGWHLDLEWVASAHNISDLVCRHDLSAMHRIGATQHDPQLGSLSLFSLLARVADDQMYASGKALDDLLRLQLHKTPQHLTCSLEAAGASAERGTPAAGGRRAHQRQK